MNQQIMDMAQAEFNRAVMNNLGIYMIAEAWGIEPRQVVRHKDGYGLLTEGFVVAEIAKQIKEMKVGQERMAATLCQLRSDTRTNVGIMGNTRVRDSGLCQRKVLPQGRRFGKTGGKTIERPTAMPPSWQ
jgi:hypothetical protein